MNLLKKLFTKKTKETPSIVHYPQAMSFNTAVNILKKLDDAGIKKNHITADTKQVEGGVCIVLRSYDKKIEMPIFADTPNDEVTESLNYITMYNYNNRPLTMADVQYILKKLCAQKEETQTK